MFENVVPISSISKSKNIPKILLFVPPWNYNELRGKKNFISNIALQGVLHQIGLLSIATNLKNFGYDVKLLDGYFYREEQILNYIKLNSPDIIGISVMTCLWDKANRILKKIKDINNKTFTVVGGPHVNLYLDSCLKECSALDAIVFGEGEEVLLKLAEQFENKKYGDIPGLIVRDELNNNLKFEIRNSKLLKPCIVEDINKLPFPDLNLLNPDINSYIPNVSMSFEKPFSTIFTTRGCVLPCAFCNEGNLFKKVRKRNINNILDEFDFLINKCLIKTINFYDDVSIFNCDINSSMIFCEELIKRKYKINWSIYLTNFNIDKNLLKTMKKAGCFRIHCAIESGVQKNRDYIRGCHFPLEKIKEKIIEINNEKIETYGRFMFGIFGETYDEGLKTIDFACSLPLSYASFINTLLSPGTQMFYDLEKIGKINPDKSTWSYYGDFYNPYPMSKKEINSLIRLGHYKFYFNRGKIINLIKKIDSASAINQYLYYAYRIMIDKI